MALSGKIWLSRALRSIPRCSASTPLNRARMSSVGAVSRFSNSLACCSVGQSPTMPVRLRAPPSTRAVEAVPWSVPPVPLTRAVRPNSVAATTTVLLHSGPRPSARPPSTLSR